MLRFSPFVAVALFAVGFTVTHAQTSPGAASSPRETISLNADWRFTKGDPAGDGDSLDYGKIKSWVLPCGNDFTTATAVPKRPVGNLGEKVAYTHADFDDSSWRRLNLPHDWGVEGPFDQSILNNETGKLPYFGVGWYRKHFAVPASDAGRQVTLAIDGAMSYSMVWLNGQFVGGWPYGYAGYQLDLTPYLKPGADNVLAIRLDNPNDSSRWYPGGGIYRNVWLIKTSPVHVGQWGTYITTPKIDADSAAVDLKVTVANATASSASVSLKTDIFELGADGQRGGAVVTSLAPISATVAAGASSVADEAGAITHPKLWDTENPNRYVAVTTVEQDGHVADVYETPFGVRTIKFDADKGFFLNGKHVLLKGVCQHGDLGSLGTALNVRGLERQFEILKEMGCNSLRTSHNPVAPELLDLCDRMGILVMNESFDCWHTGKRSHDYHVLFDDWNERDMRSIVRHARNHPSIILWSIGNEIDDQHTPLGPGLAKQLTGYCHEEDPTRPTTAAYNFIESGYNGMQDGVDVMGYNYKPKEYAKFHQAHPQQPVFGSETSSTTSSRGEYFFPAKITRADYQVTSYDSFASPWATMPDAEFAAEDLYPYVAGQYVWTGFDYLGEPTPWNQQSKKLPEFTDPALKAKAEAELKATGKVIYPSRSSYFGIVDLAGFKKDRFYLYQLFWRPDFPMAHILPHWNWAGREGQVTPVFVYTSGDEAELFLNGKSLGRKKRGPQEYRLEWNDAVYQPGELKAVAYKNGKEWATDTVKTTGAAAKLLVQADHMTLKSDGADLSYITVTVADPAGLQVPTARSHVKFEVTGPAEIAGVDNGDATDQQSFQAHEIDAFNGLAQVILRTKAGQTGAVTLKATADGLAPAEVTVKVQ